MMNLKSFLCILWIVSVFFTSIEISEAEVPHVKIGKFQQEIATSFTEEDGLPSNDVFAIHVNASGVIWAETDQGWAVRRGKKWAPSRQPKPQTLLGHVAPEEYAGISDDTVVNQAALTPEGQVVVATNQGLMQQAGSGFEPMVVEDGLGRRWGTSDVRGVAVDSQGQLWFATLA